MKGPEGTAADQEVAANQLASDEGGAQKEVPSQKKHVTTPEVKEGSPGVV